MRRAAKVDDTHKPIMDALRAASISVRSCGAVGSGFPDLCASYNGFTCLIECKTGNKRLNEMQKDFSNAWQGTIITANNPEQAVREFFKEYAVRILSKV